MTTQRERFEACMRSCGEPTWRRVDTDEYTNRAVRSAWRAWQEANRQAIERCAKVCDEKAAYARLHGGAQNGALMAEMLADDIRAMGDEDDAAG